MSWLAVISGPPRTKKTSQQIVRNKRTGKQFIVSGSANKDWETAAVEQLAAQIQATKIVQVKRKKKLVDAHVVFDGPVRVRALFYRDRDIGDATGFYQALADALEAKYVGGRWVGVLANDRQIADWDGSRRLIDRENPRVEVEVIPL